MAARTPSASVMPQIFTDGRRATLAGSSGCAPAATKARTAAAGSAARTSASPTSAPSNPSARQRRDEPGLADPRFGDDEPVVGHELAQSRGLVDIDLERAQVAVVEPDQPGAAGKGAVELARIVDLDQRLQADLERPLDQPRRAAWPDAGPRATGRGRRRPRGASGAGSPRPRSPWPGPGRRRRPGPPAGRRPNRRTSAARTGPRSPPRRRPRRRGRAPRCPRRPPRSGRPTATSA